MKKLFIVALAAFGMVACMNEEITELPNGGEITFDNAFIDNATRAELTATNMEEFKVWGYIDGLGDSNNQSVVLFEGESVTRPSGTWQYGGGARYWAPGEVHYFEAVAPTTTGAVSVNAANGKINTIDYTVDGESDLIYAAYSKEGNTDGSDNGAVSFGFDHLLSRVMFTFNNGFAEADGITLTVKNVQMTVPASGSYDVATGKWTVDANTATTLTNIEGAKFVLPYGDNYAYAIEFDVDVTYKGVVINKDVHKTSTVMVALEKGNSYNFTATIDADALDMENIEFIVGEVNGWTDTELPYENATFYVKNVEELQAALDYAVTGVMTKAVEAPVATTIFFADNITGDVVIKEVDNAPYHNITIDGREFKYDGQMKIYGNSSEGDGKLLIKNINFETETEGREFIWCADSQNGSYWRYANNVTIEGCTFTANGVAVHTAVGAKFQQCYNIKLTGCVATNMHSLLQAESCGTTVTVEKSKVVNGKNGVSFNNTMNAIISNTEIESVFEGGYGIRHKGEVNGYALTVENCKVSAFAPVLVRNMKANDYTLTFNGTNELTSTNVFDIDVVFSATDYSEDHIGALPTAPTGNYTIVGDVEDFKVFPEDVLMNDGAALQEAITAGGYVVLGGDVTVDTTLEIAEGADVVLDLNGKTITTSDEGGYAIFNKKGGTLRITDSGKGAITGIVYTGGNSSTIVEGGTFNAATGGKYVFLNSGGSLTINGGTINGGSSYPVYNYDADSKLVINDVTVNGTFGCVNSYGVGAEVEINGGTFTLTGVQGNTSHIAYFSNVDATINGGTFKKVGDVSMSGTGGGGVCVIYGANLTINGGEFAGDYADIYDWGGTNANGRANSVSISGGTYKFNPAETFIADGYHAVAQSGKYYVVKEGITAVAGSSDEFNAAVKDNAVIELAEGTYKLPSTAATYTIVGTEDTIIDVTSGLSYAQGADVTFYGVTIQSKGGTGYERGFADMKKATFNKCVINGSIGLDDNFPVKFNECVFNIEGDWYNVWTWGAPEVTFSGCTFNCDGKALLLYGTANTKCVVENCIFNDNGDDTVTGKAAIEIGNDYDKSYELIVNKTTVNGFAINPVGINTGTTLWANKNSMGHDKLNVVVDGVDVY